jgi:hypothetical protein
LRRTYPGLQALAPDRGRAGAGSLNSLIWLTLGAFAVGTEGFMIAGLLSALARDLEIGLPAAGHLVHDFTPQQRYNVCAHHPRETNFKESIIEHFASGIIKKPLTTFGNVKADVLALKDMSYVRQNFCAIILGSPWPS